MGFRSLTETIDTTSAGGMLIFTVFAALAQFERALIRERTVAGLAAARAKGRVGGRPRSLDAVGLAAVKAMLANPDVTVAQVGAALGVSRATLYRHLPAARSGVRARHACCVSRAGRPLPYDLPSLSMWECLRPGCAQEPCWRSSRQASLRG